MDADIKALSQILSRSLYLRMVAVRSGAVYEHERKDAKTHRCIFSEDPSSRDRQMNHLWARSVHAFADRGVRYAPARVEAKWVLPYRRRMFIDNVHPELRRVNDILDRARVGILEAISEAGFEERFATEAGRGVATLVLRSVVTWDLPTVAAIAYEDDSVRLVLREILGISDDELVAMMCICEDVWDALAQGDESFGVFYDNKRRA